MIQTPVIVTFANQKGGVGKTTLCVTFANYLVTMGVRVIVVDCDFQHSIVKCRKADIKKYGEQHMLYEVVAYEATDKDGMTSLMEKLHNDPHPTRNRYGHPAHAYPPISANRARCKPFCR